MNFRKVVSLCALSAAAPILAGVTGSNTTGLLEVDSTATNTIVSVPWLEVGSGSDIKVANIVRTAELTEGDMVLSADASGAYSCWVLNSDKTSWDATTVAEAAKKGFTASEGASSAALARGKGIWLIRQNPTDNSGEAIPFYLYGQYSSTAISTSITADSNSAPVYHLLGNPKSTDAMFSFADGFVHSANDTVVVPNENRNVTYTWNNSLNKFQHIYTTYDSGTKKRGLGTNFLTEVKSGTGFWYVSRGGSGTITW